MAVVLDTGRQVLVVVLDAGEGMVVVLSVEEQVVVVVVLDAGEQPWINPLRLRSKPQFQMVATPLCICSVCR